MPASVILVWLILPLVAALGSLITGSEGIISLFIILSAGSLLAIYQLILSIFLWKTKKLNSVAPWIQQFGVGYLAVFAPLMIFGMFYGFPTDVTAPINIDGPNPGAQEVATWHLAAGLHYLIMSVLIIVFSWLVGNALERRQNPGKSSITIANCIWITASVALVLLRMLVQ